MRATEMASTRATAGGRSARLEYDEYDGSDAAEQCQ